MNGESYMDFRRNYASPSKFEYGFICYNLCLYNIFETLKHNTLKVDSI